MRRNARKELALLLLASTAGGSLLLAQEARRGGREGEQISPSRQIEHPRDRAGRPRAPQPQPTLRSIDGSGNNVVDPEMGAAFTPLLRVCPSDYADGVEAMAGDDRPGARLVSNIVAAQDADLPNPLGASDFLWQWGQFVDHDIDLTDGADPAEPAAISVPGGDPFFDPSGSGSAVISFNRSIYDPDSGSDAGNPRQQLNEISAWIDASQVYGSDDERATALRANDGTGRLLTSSGDLLPFNTGGLPNAGGPSSTLFLAGDVRANEQVGLTAMHTLFVREHNRLAERLAAAHPQWDGERIYQKARSLVGAQLQAITYNEFLPALLGPQGVPPYRGYRPDADARIGNVFSSAIYRFGHSALSSTLQRLDADGAEIEQGHLALRDAFFSPSRIVDEGGIEPLLRGLAAQACQRVDPFVIDDVRNFLFGAPGSGGFDLASLNIQRGRDHGLPSYNEVREILGLGRRDRFEQISGDPEVRNRLSAAYASVDDIDLWVGGLAEQPLPGSHLGELASVVIRNQFVALRDGDRFWYERVLTAAERDDVQRTRLSDVIRRNTDIGDELRTDVFSAGPAEGPDGGPDGGGRRGPSN